MTRKKYREQKKLIVEKVKALYEEKVNENPEEYSNEALLNYAISQVGEKLMKTKNIPIYLLFALKENLISKDEFKNVIQLAKIDKFGDYSLAGLCFAGSIALGIELLILGNPFIFLLFEMLLGSSGSALIHHSSGSKTFDNKLAITLLRKSKNGDFDIFATNNTVKTDTVSAKKEIEMKLAQISSNESEQIIDQLESQISSAMVSEQINLPKQESHENATTRKK